MSGSSGFDNYRSCSWLSFAPFKMSVYSLYYAVSVDAQPFQAMAARVDIRTVLYAWHGVNCEMRVGRWIK